MRGNEGFMHPGHTCAICGAEDIPGGGVLSTITLAAGYGSTAHDGETATVYVCGDCLDWLWAALQHTR